MTKRLIDVDDGALEAARAGLGTTTIKETVNTALRLAAAERAQQLDDAFGTLADLDMVDRDEAWR